MLNYNFQIPSEDDFEKLFQKIMKEMLGKLKEKESSPTPHPIANFLTRNELAIRLRISLPTLNKHTNAGLPSHKIGKRRLYDPLEVAKYFAAKNQK